MEQGSRLVLQYRESKTPKNGVTGGEKLMGVFVVCCSWHGLEFQVTGAGSLDQRREFR